MLLNFMEKTKSDSISGLHIISTFLMTIKIQERREID